MVMLRIVLAMVAAGMVVIALLVLCAAAFGRAGWTAVLGVAFIALGALGLAARRPSVRDPLRRLMGVPEGRASGVHLPPAVSLAYLVVGVVWIALAVRYAVR